MLQMWFLLGINILSTLGGAYVFKSLTRQAALTSAFIAEITHLNVICRQGLPENVDTSSVSGNAVLCACTHPEIVCHFKENDEIRVKGGKFKKVN